MEPMDTLSRLKQKERKTRQDLIMDAAREVFGQKTYDSVSMAEIARAAGIAKSSIYTYFSSQETLYVEIAVRDSQIFLKELELTIETQESDLLDTVISRFLDYYILHEAQWRMITHFALHGKKDNASVDKLNATARKIMDLFDIMFNKLGVTHDTRLLAHTLFSSLSGILIAFRKYPGRTEAERKAHMKRIGTQLEATLMAFVQKQTTQGPN